MTYADAPARRMLVRNVTFTEDSVDLSFIVLPDDMRTVAGHEVMQMRTMIVSRDGEAYKDEIRDLLLAAEALVDDVLEDWPTATPVGPPEELDEDLGMGQG